MAYRQRFMMLTVATSPARTVTAFERHHPTSRYAPGLTENRYLAPERIVSEATGLDPEYRLTFTFWGPVTTGGSPEQA
jgi:hypothetical protein